MTPHRLRRGASHLPARRSRQNATFIHYQALSMTAKHFLQPNRLAPGVEPHGKGQQNMPFDTKPIYKPALPNLIGKVRA
jgi:hypothetical protein